MFLCVCMSPAIDATVTLPRPPRGEGEIFKDVAEEENVGGKGINVARWLAIRGAEVVCAGLLGEDNDRPFARELERHGVRDAFVRVPGATRRNEMISWPGGCVKLNRPAFPGLGADGAFWNQTLEKLSQSPQVSRHPASPRVAILSGSLPATAPRDFYARAVAALKADGWTVVLDASGEPMRLGLAAGPDLVKPNSEECEDLVGFVPGDPGSFRRATEALRAKAAHAIISDGANGAWFDGEFAAAPRVEVMDTTAAGDTLLAEYCWRAFGCGESPDEAAKWAVAAGSAACTMPGGAPPSVDLVQSLRDNR